MKVKLMPSRYKTNCAIFVDGNEINLKGIVYFDNVPVVHLRTYHLTNDSGSIDKDAFFDIRPVVNGYVLPEAVNVFFRDITGDISLSDVIITLNKLLDLIEVDDTKDREKVILLDSEPLITIRLLESLDVNGLNCWVETQSNAYIKTKDGYYITELDSSGDDNEKFIITETSEGHIFEDCIDVCHTHKIPSYRNPYFKY